MTEETEPTDTKQKVHPLDRAWAGGLASAKLTIPKDGLIIKMEFYDETLTQKWESLVQLGKRVDFSAKDTSKHRFAIRWQTRSANESRELIMFLSPFLVGSRYAQAALMKAKIERSAYWRQKFPEIAEAAGLPELPPTPPRKPRGPNVNKKKLKMTVPPSKRKEPSNKIFVHEKHAEVFEKVRKFWVVNRWGSRKLHAEFPEVKEATLAVWVMKFKAAI